MITTNRIGMNLGKWSMRIYVVDGEFRSYQIEMVWYSTCKSIDDGKAQLTYVLVKVKAVQLAYFATLYEIYL